MHKRSSEFFDFEPGEKERHDFVLATAAQGFWGYGTLQVRKIQWTTKSHAWVVGTFPLSKDGSQIGKVIFRVACMTRQMGQSQYCLKYRNDGYDYNISNFPSAAVDCYLGLDAHAADKATIQQYEDTMALYDRLTKTIEADDVFETTGAELAVNGAPATHVLCINKYELRLVSVLGSQLASLKDCFRYMAKVKSSAIKPVATLPEDAVIHGQYAFRNEGNRLVLAGKLTATTKMAALNGKHRSGGASLQLPPGIPGLDQFSCLGWLS